jgi:hypothetical protein
MTQLSISAAAQLVGKDRKTLYRLIKQGKLSATVGDSGMSQVETSELLRFFGAFNGFNDTRDSGETVASPQLETPNVPLLQAELRHALELSRVKDEVIQDLRTTLRLLEYKAPQKKSWWKL